MLSQNNCNTSTKEIFKNEDDILLSNYNYKNLLDIEYKTKEY